MGYVTLEPGGGQVPWHNQEQEEVYFIVQGNGEACVGQERTDRRRRPGAVRPAATSSTSSRTSATEPLVMIYVYAPAATWRTGARSWTARCRGRAWRRRRCPRARGRSAAGRPR